MDFTTSENDVLRLTKNRAVLPKKTSFDPQWILPILMLTDTDTIVVTYILKYYNVLC